MLNDKKGISLIVLVIIIGIIVAVGVVGIFFGSKFISNNGGENNQNTDKTDNNSENKQTERNKIVSVTVEGNEFKLFSTLPEFISQIKTPFKLHVDYRENNEVVRRDFTKDNIDDLYKIETDSLTCFITISFDTGNFYSNGYTDCINIYLENDEDILNIKDREIINIYFMERGIIKTDDGQTLEINKSTIDDVRKVLGTEDQLLTTIGQALIYKNRKDVYEEVTIYTDYEGISQVELQNFFE